MSYTHALIVFGVFTSSPLNGQVEFDVTRLQAGRDSMRISLIQGTDTTLVGMLWDDITLSQTGELRRVYRTENQLFGPHQDTVISQLPDLRPVRRWSRSQTSSDSLHFMIDSVVGWRADADGKHPVSRRLPTGIIDAHSFDLVVRSADLRTGHQFSILAYISTQDTVAQLLGTVVGTERVTLSDGMVVDAWRITGDFVGLEVEFWVDRDSRALVQQVIHLSPMAAMYMLR